MSEASGIEFTREQTDRLGHWLSECLDDAAPLNERVWRTRAEWMVKGPTFQSVLHEVIPAVPDPTVEALSEAEQRMLDTALDPLGDPRGEFLAIRVHEAVADILAARAAAPDALRVRIEALAAEHAECWVTRSAYPCTEYIGATFSNGVEWVEAMCCLPCRVRALLEDRAAAVAIEALS